MFENIGRKIKKFASFLTWIGIIASIITGIIYIDNAFNGGVVGILIIVLGSLVSWISSWLLYGYGELIENTSIIARNTTPKDSTNTTQPIVPKQPTQLTQPTQPVPPEQPTGTQPIAPEQPTTAEKPITPAATTTTDEEEITFPRWAIPAIICVVVFIVAVAIIASL